jgi:hypothetical protein
VNLHQMAMRPCSVVAIVAHDIADKRHRTHELESHSTNERSNIATAWVLGGQVARLMLTGPYMLTGPCPLALFRLLAPNHIALHLEIGSVLALQEKRQLRTCAAKLTSSTFLSFPRA